MVGGRVRLSLAEYGAPKDLSDEIVGATGLDRARATQLLLDSGERAAGILGFGSNPISVDNKGARAGGIAGLIRLGPSLELEIAPKFLGLDDSHARWREDFFYLATLSRHGRLLASERLAASGGVPRDLATLVARAIADMYVARRSRPLRSYRRARETGFFVDGDPDPIDLLLPGPDGFEQEVTRFDRQNSWNGVIAAAAAELLPEVSDGVVAAHLLRVVEDLSPQRRKAAASRKPFPARHRSWRPLYELSVDVLKGLGLTYRQGQAQAPGYLVATWQVWEDLLTIASRIGFGRAAVSAQEGFRLGTRSRPSSPGAGIAVPVFPDCVIAAQGPRPRFLLDAKYKGNVERGLLRIEEGDIYEAMAFARATACDCVVLAYPAAPEGRSGAPGNCTVFERVYVAPVSIIGVQVEVRGIAKAGALRGFATRFMNGLSAAFE